MIIEPRDVFILSMRHAITPPATYTFIAARLELSEERVRYLHKRILRSLRIEGGVRYPVTLDDGDCEIQE